MVTAVQEALQGLRSAGLSGQVIVVDNGSTDGSAVVAAALGATIVWEPRRGYGMAIRRGLQTARGDVIVLADADSSYDLCQLGQLVQRVVQRADIVVGTRTCDRLEVGAMPWLHRHVGIPGLNLLPRWRLGAGFATASPDFVPSSDRFIHLGCTSTGMEYATEMLLMAHRAGFRIEEVPVRYRRRTGASSCTRSPTGSAIAACCFVGPSRAVTKCATRDTDRRRKASLPGIQE